MKQALSSFFLLSLALSGSLIHSVLDLPCNSPEVAWADEVQKESPRADGDFQLKFFDITEGQLAFTYSLGESQDIYRIDFSSLEVKPLIQGPDKKSNPRYSPDGKRLLYNAEVKGQTLIFVADSDGKNISKINCGTPPCDAPAWSPDGKKILFTTVASGNTAVMMMDADGTHLQALLKNAHKNSSPSISPRGDELLYSSNQDWPGWDIFLLDLNSKVSSSLTKGDASFLFPSWQPFGDGFIFGRSDGAKISLWYATRGAAQAVRLTELDARYLDPTWIVDSNSANTPQFIFATKEKTGGKADYQLVVAKVQLSKANETAPLLPEPTEFVPALFAKGIVRSPSFSPFPSVEALTKKLERKVPSSTK